jgi:hypothetical protein
MGQVGGTVHAGHEDASKERDQGESRNQFVRSGRLGRMQFAAEKQSIFKKKTVKASPKMKKNSPGLRTRRQL